MVFDTHAHVLSPDREAYPFGPLRGGAVSPVEPVSFPVEQLLQRMDEQGVERACLVQRATLYGYDNSYALDSAERHSDRLAPVIVLDAEDPASVRKLERLADRHRLAGVRIVAPRLSEQDTDWLDGEQAMAFWTAAERLRLPVAVILFRLNNTAGRAALAGVAKRIAGIPILVDHVGLPHSSTPEKKWAESQGIDYTIAGPPGFGIEEDLAILAEAPNLHFKVTDINFDRLDEAGYDTAEFLRALLDRLGADRIAWGSDVGQSPAPYADKLARLEAALARLSPSERQAVTGGTAERIYAGAFGARP